MLLGSLSLLFPLLREMGESIVCHTFLKYSNGNLIFYMFKIEVLNFIHTLRISLSSKDKRQFVGYCVNLSFFLKVNK
jgi:hypothetical protein